MGITNTMGRKGPMASSFTATLEGGPQLAAALKRLELTAAGQAAKDAVMAMGGTISDAWADRVPVEHGDYRQEMHTKGVVKAGINKGTDPEGLRVLKGASGSVGPRQKPAVPGLAEDQQPYVYAAVLEFGGYIEGAYHPARASARPAFDASKQAAVAAGEAVLRRAVEALTR